MPNVSKPINHAINVIPLNHIERDVRTPVGDLKSNLAIITATVQQVADMMNRLQRTHLRGYIKGKGRVAVNENAIEQIDSIAAGIILKNLANLPVFEEQMDAAYRGLVAGFDDKTNLFLSAFPQAGKSSYVACYRLLRGYIEEYTGRTMIHLTLTPNQLDTQNQFDADFSIVNVIADYLTYAGKNKSLTSVDEMVYATTTRDGSKLTKNRSSGIMISRSRSKNAGLLQELKFIKALNRDDDCILHLFDDETHEGNKSPESVRFRIQAALLKENIPFVWHSISATQDDIIAESNDHQGTCAVINLVPPKSYSMPHFATTKEIGKALGLDKTEQFLFDNMGMNESAFFKKNADAEFLLYDTFGEFESERHDMLIKIIGVCADRRTRVGVDATQIDHSAWKETRSICEWKRRGEYAPMVIRLPDIDTAKRFSNTVEDHFKSSIRIYRNFGAYKERPRSDHEHGLLITPETNKMELLVVVGNARTSYRMPKRFRIAIETGTGASTTITTAEQGLYGRLCGHGKQDRIMIGTPDMITAVKNLVLDWVDRTVKYGNMTVKHSQMGGTDGALIVLDDLTGREYDFFCRAMSRTGLYNDAHLVETENGFRLWTKATDRSFVGGFSLKDVDKINAILQDYTDEEILPMGAKQANGGYWAGWVLKNGVRTWEDAETAGSVFPWVTRFRAQAYNNQSLRQIQAHDASLNVGRTVKKTINGTVEQKFVAAYERGYQIKVELMDPENPEHAEFIAKYGMTLRPISISVPVLRQARSVEMGVKYEHAAVARMS